jgi:lipopolysaccharide biosynthesis glycosyltransferase
MFFEPRYALKICLDSRAFDCIKYDCVTMMTALPTSRHSRIKSVLVGLNSFAIEVAAVGIEPLIIACAADRQYALPLAVMLRSTATNLAAQRAMKVYVVDGGLGAEAKTRIVASLPERVELQWIRPERTDFVDLPLWGRMTISTYDKLMLGRWLPTSVERAIWLDCDLMVLADLTRLWETGTGQHRVLAAQDVLVRTLGARFGVACHEELGIDPAAEYFNAGVMLVDVARWRKEDIAGRAIAYLKEHRRRVFFWDQEALNAVLAGEWKKLDPRWNWNPGFRGAASANGAHQDEEHSPWIVHFSGKLKPWRFEGHSASYRLYYEYLDATAWAGWRPPRSWQNAALSFYESSRFRNILSPLEQLAMMFERARTLRYVSEDTNVASLCAEER